MSRRHKENDIDNIKPQQAESHEDGSQERHYHLLDFLKFTITKRDGKKDRFSPDKIASAISKAFSKAYEDDKIEVDDVYVKIPRRYVEHYELFEEEQRKSKAGRNPIKRLFARIADSKVVQFFHDTLDAVKLKCEELYEDITQFSVCFFKSAFKVFSPDDDSYGKQSHYHRIFADEVPDFPSRKTLNNWCKWFDEWKPAIFNESRTEKKERARHRLWEKLIEWIQRYLLQIAPQYVVV